MKEDPLGVILSVAKDLQFQREVLRFAQHDSEVAGMGFL